MYDLLWAALQHPLLIAATQLNFSQVVFFHHFDQLLKLVEIE